MENQPPPPIAVLSTIAQELGAIRRLPQGNVPDWLWKQMGDWHERACVSLVNAREMEVSL